MNLKSQVREVALKLRKTEYKKHEDCMKYNFDLKILKLNDLEFYFHKIILISCSDYFNNYFLSLKDKNLEEKPIEDKPQNEENNEVKNQDNKNKNKIIVNFPEIISSSFGGILPLIILIATVFHALDLVLFYCLVYYFGSSVIMSLKYILKAVNKSNSINIA